MPSCARMLGWLAATVRPPRGRARREGQALSLAQVRALASACRGRYGDVVLVLALAGLRWGELAGLQVRDLVSVPGRGLRVQRAVLASHGGGRLYVDTLKSGRARTVALVAELVPVVDEWVASKSPDAWIFAAPEGGPLRESNWKRSVGWTRATTEVGVRTTTYATPPHPSGSPRARTRRWFSGCSAMPPHP
ncbi:tyrosine-type recombinase/integrase [Actinopolymorpha alba]|uniref:tyrosine-type recombinase/integrase n=1 Tax=Actinopolymorpha alba TaxID=533267 RepID=UPI0003A56798|nr:tyrosine-type recombinase/integrase [Actinopolymorpha alba]